MSNDLENVSSIEFCNLFPDLWRKPGYLPFVYSLLSFYKIIDSCRRLFRRKSSKSCKCPSTIVFQVVLLQLGRYDFGLWRIRYHIIANFIKLCTAISVGFFSKVFFVMVVYWSEVAFFRNPLKERDQFEEGRISFLWIES